MTTLMQDIINRSIGCLAGALIGDAFGGRYEFSDGLLNPELMDSMVYKNKNGKQFREYIPMLGGGCWNLLPGQITDDGELTLCLATSIVLPADKLKAEHHDYMKKNPLSIVNREIIGTIYMSWYESNPFDIGQTTRNSFCQKSIQDMMDAAQKLDDEYVKLHSDHLMSNGMLMRLSPLGILVAGYLFKKITKKEHIDKYDYIRIKFAVKQDTYLTHPSENALHYAIMYVCLIAYSIIYGDMVHGIEFLEKYSDKSIGCWYKILTNGLDETARLAHDPKKLIGDSRIAMQLAIRKGMMVSQNNADNNRNMDFSEAIISTVKLGGDTDTNACIVGGLCGALCGIDEIPDPWIEKIKNVKCKRYNEHQINEYVSIFDKLAKKIFNIGYGIL